MPDVTIVHNFDEAQRMLRRAFDKFPDMVQDGIRRTERDIMADLQRSVATWDHPVEFSVSTQTLGRTIRTSIGTDDEIFGYVDQGTKPHAIVPRHPGYPLRFRSQYQAKTTPGQIWSKQGGASGNWVYAMRVWHPGTKPRRILETIMRKHEITLLRTINLALSQGISKIMAKMR